jgi:hypothetical protein
MSSVYVRGLFSHFNDYGEDWIYSPGISTFPDPSSFSDPTVNTCGLTSASQFGNPAGCGGISFTDVYRKPVQQVVSVQAGARHVFGGTVLNYEAALSAKPTVSGSLSPMALFRFCRLRHLECAVCNRDIVRLSDWKCDRAETGSAPVRLL